MSVQALSAVLDHSQATGSARLVAISFANHADKNGLFFVSTRLAAQEAKVSHRSVKDARKKLKEIDELEVVVEADGAEHRPTLYLLKLPGLSGQVDEDHPYFAHYHPRADSAPGGSAGSAPEGVKQDDPPGCKSRTTPVQDATPGLIEEPSTNRPLTEKDFLHEVFDLWKQLTGRNGSTKFSPKRQRVIKARLSEGHTEDEIRRAVFGCSRSDWHMQRGKYADRDGDRHDDLTLILRDSEHVERFARMAGDAPLPGGRPDVTETAAASTTWKQAKDRLRASVPESTFQLWLEPLEIAGERDGTLVLLDTRDQGAWTSRRYRGIILEAVKAVTGDYTAVELIDHTGLELEEAA